MRALLFAGLLLSGCSKPTAQERAITILITADTLSKAMANLGRGLLANVAVAPPESWPSPEPVGTATSWICEGPEGSGQSGVHIEGTQAARCRHKTCDAATFAPPTG